MPDPEQFPPHWMKAASAVGVTLPRQLLLDGKKAILIGFNLSESRDWASTSMTSDEIYPEYLEKELELPTGSISGKAFQRYVSLNPMKIPANDFRVRYPDVPYSLAHEFVLLHEVGHALRGWREERADDYAFARLLLVPDRVASEKRSLWYSRMKHPFDFIAAISRG